MPGFADPQQIATVEVDQEAMPLATATPMKIETCTHVGQVGWLGLRQALWPECTAACHLREMVDALAQPARFTQVLAYDDEDCPLGLAEASVRTDYVNGTSSSPVAFLEGIYVIPEMRRRGVARALLAALETWAAGAGYSEFASDARTENQQSRAFHRQLGFEEMEQVVFFRKRLDQ